MTDVDNDIAHLKNLIDAKRARVIRHKNQLHFFKPVQKAFAKGKIEGYEKAIEELEKLEEIRKGEI